MQAISGNQDSPNVDGVNPAAGGTGTAGMVGSGAVPGGVMPFIAAAQAAAAAAGTAENTPRTDDER